MVKADHPTGKNDPEHHRLDLHLAGILRLLSEHLYADPKAALREVIQNAYDSCIRRLVEDESIEAYSPHIDISIDAVNRTISIQDNGSGLTYDEIQSYLSTIGRGYTAELDQRLAFREHAQADRLIGQFGLGILAALIAADRLELITRSFKANSEAWRWVCEGSETYTIVSANRKSAGSTLILHLNLTGEFLLNEGLVREIIRLYADFLSVPITINGGKQPANAVDAPWHMDAGIDAYRAFIADRFGDYFPLTVIPLHDHIEEVSVPGSRVDSVRTPLRGVLFVPSSSTLSLLEYGDLIVYIRRMFITDQERGLLPSWARFVQGIVDTPALNPTASREQVRRDDQYTLVQRILERQLLDHFVRVAHEQPSTWRRIVQAHNDLIKAWALDSPAFFEAVGDVVTFETNRGQLALPEILSAGEGMIYYTTEERGVLQEMLLFDSAGLIVVDASRFAEALFIEQYANSRPGVELHRLTPGESSVFEPIEDEAGEYASLLRYYSDQGISVRLARFEPEAVPAILVFPPGSDEAAKARAALDGGEVSPSVARLIEEYLALQNISAEIGQGVLHLNLNNSLVRHTCNLSPNEEPFAAVLEIIYYNARLFARHSLTPAEARQGFDMIAFSIDRLVRALTERDDHRSGPGEG
ncbi:MAG: ATP-binding protein [Anaerolineae bacterium]|nr:ATP-binding protein [Anaerolineae bacterium]